MKGRRILRDNIQGITKPAIQRAAHQAGIKTLDGLCYEEMRGILMDHLQDTVGASLTYTRGRMAKTVSQNDVVNGVKNSHGTNLATSRKIKRFTGCKM
jgi:histone H4